MCEVRGRRRRRKVRCSLRLVLSHNTMHGVVAGEVVMRWWQGGGGRGV